MAGYDEFLDSGGGLLLDYTGTVTDRFFVAGKYGTQLQINVMLDNPEDHPKIKDGTVLNWFNLGKGWAIEAGGDRIVGIEWTANNGNAQPAPTKFRNDSDGGRLLAQVASIDSDAKLLTNGTPFEAAYWGGIGHARWGACSFDKRVENEAGEWVVQVGGKRLSMPVELLDGQIATEFDLATLNLDPTMLTTLTTLAGTIGNTSAFVAAVVKDKVVMPGTPAWSAITGQQGKAVYEALGGAF